ncbi:hypothetical protein [Ancylobacter radicis]|uniref:Uncharacterized protein n=1 Tax=Ancylobacter radicis TaxID=2836179 RepID=A0ABS5R870_9HYPH|nr:hypothetical protein [Ancylobacter radicis]MBS9477866.1 hypothetical protein [Ancylobacter radicis]
MPASHSELPAFLKTIDTLIAAGNYKEVAETYTAFVTEHPTTSYLASEPIPFKVNAHLSTKYGSSATTTFTLRNTTWTSDVKSALKAGGDAFASLLAKYDAEVAEIAQSVKKVA